MFGWLSTLVRSDPMSRSLGRQGENVAARHLRNQGFRIIARNFTCPLGEIDIIARQGATLVFVEVKTRTDDEPSPEDQVNYEKRHRLTRLARYYLSRFGSPEPPARFDIVGVVWPARGGPIIRHTPDAFAATD
jgi:putative endonuclease